MRHRRLSRPIVELLLLARSGGVTLVSAAASVSGTTITVTATSSGDLSAAVFGVEYSTQDNGGSLTGYTFSKNVVGAASSQSITVTAADGVTSDSTVTVRAYYNLDVLDDPSTRVYANDIVPYVVAGIAPTGTQTEGETLTQVQGVIAGSSPLTVTYQWQNDGGTGTWGNIGGATSATYELQASDVGDDVAVVHTGTNSAGADNARSAETGPIASATLPEVTFIATASLVQSSGVYTATAANIGTASATRKVIVVASGSGFRTTSSATIAGVAATIHVETVANNAWTAIYSANVSTGTTGDIVLTMSGSLTANQTCAVYTADTSAMISETPAVDTGTVSGGTSVTVNAAETEGGFAVGGTGFTNGASKTAITVTGTDTYTKDTVTVSGLYQFFHKNAIAATGTGDATTAWTDSFTASSGVAVWR